MFSTREWFNFLKLPVVVPDGHVLELDQVEDGSRHAADEKDDNNDEENPEKDISNHECWHCNFCRRYHTIITV